MKILQVGKFYPIRGGVEKIMYELMLGLSAQGIHCDMLCASTEGHPAATIQLNSFANIFVVPTSLKLASTTLAPKMVTRLRRCARDYDIIHIHHPDPMACLALFLAGYKGKVVLHWHSDILKQKTLLKLYTPLQNWLLKRAGLIVGTTPVYVQKSPFLTKVQDKLDYIPIGVEPILASIESIARIRRKYNNRKLVFSVGRLVEYKGYEYLIRAAAKLDDSYRIVIGGMGPLREALEALIVQEGLSDKVELIGFVSDEELAAYFQACDLFCLSSIWKTEAFGIVQIEAMSASKPVVSTAIPGSGVSWVNAHGVSGLVAPAADAKGLANAIQQVFMEPEQYHQLAEGSRKRYNDFFTRKIMVDKCLRLYAKVLNG